MAGRPRKVENSEVEVKVSDKVKGLNAPDPYHIMVRYLGMANVPERNIFTGETVKNHIKTWVDQGYKIHTTAYIGRQKDDESGVIAEGVYFLFEYVG